MKLFIFILIIIPILFCCKNEIRDNNQEDSLNKINKVNTEVDSNMIIDSFPSLTFDIKNKPKLILPDSLGGQEINGFASISFIIDDKGNLKTYKIVKLLVKDNDNILIDISNLENGNYSKMVKKYTRFLDNYIRSLVFVKNPDAEIKGMNRLMRMFRFNE